MVATIPFNPSVTTNAAGSFLTSTSGYVQGTALDDPAIRNTLAGGIVSQSETIPMWGGLGITENLPFEPNTSAQSDANLGSIIGRATTISATGAAGALTGFSVFDQNHSMINTPQSPVPLAASGMQMNFYRLGSGMRIAVKCAPSLISLDNAPVTQQVSWDFVNQELVPFAAAYGPNTISNATWATTGGGQYTYTYSGTSLVGVLAAGSVVDISGIVSTFAGISPNGNFVVVSVGATTLVVTAAAAANAGAYTSGGAIAAGGGALPILGVLRVQQTNCMTVVYNAVTGFATWNRNDACAIIRL